MINKSGHKHLIALGDNNAEHHFIVKDSSTFSHHRQILHVELEEDADGFTVLTYKGKKFAVEVLSKKQNNYEIRVNGVSYSFSVETPFSLKRKRMLASLVKDNKVEAIKAPMPGKVLNILVKEGQTVNAGEGLLILEAMKMQNTLIASSKGVVEKVSAKMGCSVGKDELLLEIAKG